jgi:hypothetical protein
MDASTNRGGGSDQYRAVGGFLGRLRQMSDGQLASVVAAVVRGRSTAAADVDWWQATTAVSVELRRLRRGRAAASAALQAGEAVLAAPGANEIPHDDLVHAARAAGDVARVLVAGGPSSALTILGRGWEVVLGPCGPLPRSTAA